MPTLEFKGKQFVYSHHLGVPFRELQVDAAKSLPAKGTKPSLDDNLIIHGDNLEALKALLPTHAGKIDCIFIDALQHRQRRLVLQRQRPLAADARMAQEIGQPGGQGRPRAPRQVAVHDVAAVEFVV
jgi:hypothetical protein